MERWRYNTNDKWHYNSRKTIIPMLGNDGLKGAASIIENCHLDEICDKEIKAFEVEGLLIVLKHNQGVASTNQTLIIFEQSGDNCKRVRTFLSKLVFPTYTKKELKKLLKMKNLMDTYE